jgi:hypothetical protein
MSKTEQQSDFLPEIRVGRIGVLKVHQISDDELSQFGQGSRQTLFLNFGIGVLSVAVAFLISLLTTTITSDRLFTTFVIVTVVGFLAGIVLMILWWCTRKPISILVQKIRDRMPPEGEAQQLPAPDHEGRAGAPSGSGET